MAAQKMDEWQNTERIFARGFLILGGLFWIVGAFAGPYYYRGVNLAGAFGTAIYPLVFTIAVLALGWFYERLTSLVLALAAIGTVIWGVFMGWEPNVWTIMLSFFVLPTVISAVLFFLAGRSQVAEAPTSAQPHAGAHA